MKKVNCICLHKDYHEIVNVTVTTRDYDNICLCDNTDNPAHAYHYYYFADLYKGVLNMLKSNNFYTHSYRQFGRSWHSITFIDTETHKVEKFGISTHYHLVDAWNGETEVKAL